MTASAPPVREVTPAHYFDPAPLEAWLRAAVEDFGDAMVVQQFQGGASNPTFLLTTQVAGRPPALRAAQEAAGRAAGQRPPGGPRVPRDEGAGRHRLPGAEDAGLLRRRSGHRHGLLRDGLLEGRIFRDARLPGMEPAERAAIYDDLNATLARLHQVDFAAIGLADYGRPGNYFQRQIDRWTKQYRGAETELIPGDGAR
jgi:aminoglycoside phosphotransferase (APT) family kinase protein